MSADDTAATDALGDLEDVCGDLSRVPTAEEIAARETEARAAAAARFARVAVDRTAVVIPFVRPAGEDRDAS